MPVVEQLASRLPSACGGDTPGTLVWASSSTITTSGRRAMIASTSISSSVTPAILDAPAAE